MQALFDAGAFRAHELAEADLPALQAFFDANPAYFVTVNGAPPRPDEARHEFDDRPPKEMPFGRVHVIGFVDDTGSLVAMASLLSDLLAPRVWHIGLFIVATSLHGSGAAASIYRDLEAWGKASGAAWIRLGAVAGNTQAERFWQKVGYVELRRRTGITLGVRTHTIRVFAKALGDAGLDEYLRLVARDRPESTSS